MVFVEREEYQLERTLCTLPRTTRGLPLVITASPDGRTLVYCNGNSVIMRDIVNPSEATIYTEHAHPTTCARYAPSGFYMASADQAGKLRVWDTTQKEHLLKAEYPVISGPIRDIAWSPDSKRLAVVGEGKDRFGHVFLFDTGTSNGSLSGQSKAMTSLDYRPERPYRIVSASEDNSVALFEGPPFKFKTLFHQHTRFALCVRYQPIKGALFASGGADGKVFLYEGGEGEVVGELVDAAIKGSVAHAGGVYSLAWTPDGSRILTASGDKTCKLWNVDAKSLLATFTFGNAIEDQQLACVCAGEHFISVALSGEISYLDANDASRPVRKITGHNKSITSCAITHDKRTLFTGDAEGQIGKRRVFASALLRAVRWDLASSTCIRVAPKIHSANVTALFVHGDASALTSTAWDDTVAVNHTVMKQGIDPARIESTKLASQPRGVAVSSDGSVTAVACQKEVCVLRSGGRVLVHRMDAECMCIDMHPNGRTVAVGCMDSKVHILQLDDAACTPLNILTHHQPITCVRYSDNGRYLVAADSGRRIVPYDVQDNYSVASSKEWTFHTAKVACVAWSPDNRRLATGALDTNVCVWDMQNTGEHPIIIKGAHPMSHVTALAWMTPTRLISCGHDSNVKLWAIDEPATP